MRAVKPNLLGTSTFTWLKEKREEVCHSQQRSLKLTASTGAEMVQFTKTTSCSWAFKFLLCYNAVIALKVQFFMKTLSFYLEQELPSTQNHCAFPQNRL